MSGEPVGPMVETGERMVPESSHQGNFLEHISRYRFALSFVPGKRVLDIACGEGYGTAALARAGAAQIVGVDIDAATVEHARRKYGIDARVGRAEQIPLPDRSCDLVVSFETVEHVADPSLFFKEVARVLVPGGTLVISTPNRRYISADSGPNPFHLAEMDEAEFQQAVGRVFRHARYYSQRLVSAPLGSLRGLAAHTTSPRVRIFSSLVFRLRKWFCSEYHRLPAGHRADPVRAITGFRPTLADRLFDPFLVRPWRPNAGEEATILLAVAVL